MSRVYQVITDRILACLERGVIPWRQPWATPENQPKNLVSGRPYRGINALVLSTAAYDSPWWLTYRQAKARGGHVREGEHGFPCIYWNSYRVLDVETARTETRPFARYYTLFNVAQCDGVEAPPTPEVRREFSPLEACERVVSEMPRPPRIEHGYSQAAYRWQDDLVMMPRPQLFDAREHYYATLFHELIHSTGHKTRLNRVVFREDFYLGSPSHAREELIAEIGSAFLCGHVGIENTMFQSSASYIATWMIRLQNDNRLVVHAAGRAQKAADYVLNRREDHAEPDGSTDPSASSP